MTASISEFVFGHLDNDTVVKRYTLQNSRGTRAEFTNLGAAWIGFQRPEDQQSLVLGCDTLDAFLHQQAYFGATVGRFANRIGQGRFDMDGQHFQLDINAPPNHLHGGSDGLSSKVWSSHITLKDDTVPTLTFRCHSADGESGYPANVTVEVVITLSDDDSVRFEYRAESDARTLLNLTNHTYFNLSGDTAGNLQGQEIRIDGERFLEADDNTLPTGDIVSMAGTGLDFRQWTDIAQRLETSDDPRLDRAAGIDHCFCFEQDRKFRRLASVRSTTRNLQLECHANLPGMQFYTGNFLEGTPKNDDTQYAKHGAFCLEPGFWPDSPNHPHFPDCFIDEKSPYSAIIEYTFESTVE